VTTRIHDLKAEFLGTEAAKLITGAYDNAQQHDSYRATLELLQSSYEIALGHFREISHLDEAHSWRESPPDTSLQSTALQQCIRLLEVDPRGATITAWLPRSMSAFEAQKFGRQELQRWVDAHGLKSEYQFFSVAVAAAPAQTEPQKIDYGLLATRDQLISAFGLATKMDMSWFKSMNYSPGLQSARKVKGHGQRGHTLEPLFCPYEVMEWLIGPRRRKGRPLNKDKGWLLLEQNFPRVYNINSIGDPRK